MRPSAALRAVSSFSLLTFSLRLQVASFWVPHFHRLHYIFCQQSFARCTLMPHLNNTMSSSWCRIYLFGFYKTSWACLKVESMKLKSANIMVSSACAACTPNDWQVVHLGSLLQEDSQCLVCVLQHCDGGFCWDDVVHNIFAIPSLEQCAHSVQVDHLGLPRFVIVLPQNL